MSNADENWRNLVRALHAHADHSQETKTHGCAALAVTNKLLAETVGFLHQNANLLEKHKQRLDALDKQVELLPAYIRVQTAHAACIDADRKRLDAMEKELAQGRGDAEEEGEQGKAAEQPEPIGQAWVYRSDGETFWGTLVGGGGTIARQACLTQVACVFHPAELPPGRAVLVNLVPVGEGEELRDESREALNTQP